MLALLLGVNAAAQDARTELPITQKLGANGRYYYFIPVSVGGSAPFPALLDTGSSGLMLLPGVIGPGDADESGRRSTYGYGSGSQFTTVLARGVVKLGGLATAKPVTMRLVKAVACRDGRPNCPAAGHSVTDFGFAEESGMGSANRARIGISLGSSDADNPLAELGSGAWIIELPRPGDAAAGRLILNPGAAEMAGFVRLRAARQSGEIAGCVIDQTSKQSVCGNVLLDTGGNGMIVEARQRPASFPWPDGDPAALVMTDDRGAKQAMAFSVKHVPGDPAALHWQQGNMPQARISGSAPFLAYAVLFDSSRHEIGFKPR